MSNVWSGTKLFALRELFLYFAQFGDFLIKNLVCPCVHGPVVTLSLAPDPCGKRH